MSYRAQILIITDRQRIIGDDTDIVTMLSLTSEYGGTPALIEALTACQKYGLEQLGYYPHFIRTIAHAFLHGEYAYEEAGLGIMPYTQQLERGVSVFDEPYSDLLKFFCSEEHYLPVIDLTDRNDEEPVLYLMPRISDHVDYRQYRKPGPDDIYPLTDEGLTKAIERIVWTD
mgnify:CR=1 FL=1|jgi:hypothetical protein